MDIAELDVCNLDFMKFVKTGDFEGAHAALSVLVADRSICPASHAKWRAVIFERSGDHRAAVDVLSPVIERDDLVGKFAMHHRARIYLAAGLHDEALVDLQVLMNDETPRVIAALRQGCQFQIAYILALRGDPSFREICDQIPDGREYFVVNSIVTKPDIQELYQANQKRSTRGLDGKRTRR